MRTYPPIIVSLLAVLVFVAVSASAVMNEAERYERDSGQQAVEVATYQTEPPEHTATASTEVSTATMPPYTPAPEQPHESAIYSRDWDGEDSEMLMKIAMAEAEGESVEGKALVMLVVLNRVWSDDFPNTIEEVIFQPVQFSTVSEGGRYWTTEPDDGCREALRLLLDGWDESYGALYFESGGKDGWHSQNLEFLYQFGGHKFYR